MASLTCLRPACPLLGHGGLALSAIPNRFSSMNSVLSSANPLQKTRLLAMAKTGFSPSQDQVASSGDLEFVAPLKIVQYPDPRLRARNKRIVTFDDNLKKLVHEMFDVMYRTDGIGLSAPQVGMNVQLMVFNPVGERGEGEEIVLVNPRVSKYSKKLVPFTEGCLSFPGINADVKRPESVKIDARDINGTRFSVNLADLPARIFQHEFDHLQGILFFDRMTDGVLDSIRGQLQIFPRGYLLLGKGCKHMQLDIFFLREKVASKHLQALHVSSNDQQVDIFTKPLPRQKFELLMDKLKALEMEYEGMTGLPSPEKIENRRRRKAAAGFGKS